MAETYYSLTDIVKLCDNLVAAMPTSFYSGIMTVRTGLANIPAADVAPVVRCKDCKYGVPTKNGFLNDMIACENEDSPCGYSSWLCQPDWFCADGERREVQDGAET